MTAFLVTNIAGETGIPIAEAEHRWAKAKTITHDAKGLNPSDGDAYWRYVTGVFKKAMGIGGDDAVLESAVQPNQTPTVSQDQSKKAMKFTLDTQKNTMEGASRPDTGWIAFLWGIPGTAPLFADGDGLARIIAKQDFEKKYLSGEPSGRDKCMRLVDIVTRGYIKRKYGPTSRPKIDFSWQGEVATVSWEPARKTWYLSAWREDWGGILESATSDTTPGIDVDSLVASFRQPWEMTKEEIIQSSLRLSYDEFGDQAVSRLNHQRISSGRPVMKEGDERGLRVQATIASRARFTDPIIAAKTFQDIADVFGDVFGVKLDDEPSMESALYESAKTGDFVMSPNGTINFGQITPEIASIIKRQAGFIRMRPEHESHIETNRNTQLDQSGFDKVVNLVYEIAQKYNQIYEGRGRSLILAETSGKTLLAYIELEPGAGSDFYSVKSALSSRSDYLKNKRKLWDRAQSYHLSEETPSAISGQSLSDKRLNPSGDNVNKIFEGWETKPAVVVDQDKIDSFFDYGQLGSAPYEAITNIKAEVNRVLPGALRQDSGPLFWDRIGRLQETVKAYLRRYANLDDGTARQIKDRFLAPILNREWPEIVSMLTTTEGTEPAVIDMNVGGDIKIKVSTKWKDQIQSANSFDDIYLAFKSAGLLGWLSPSDPGIARKVYDTIDWLNPVMDEYNAAGGAVRRLEIHSKIWKKMSEVGDTVTSHVRHMSPGLENIPMAAQLQKEAGQEIFENSKAKGAAIVEAWRAGPEYAHNRQEVDSREKAILEVKKQQSEAEADYLVVEKKIQDRVGYTQANADAIKAMDAAGAKITAALEKIRANGGTWMQHDEAWNALKIYLDDAHENARAVASRIQDKLAEVSTAVYGSEEYLAAKDKFNYISMANRRHVNGMQAEIKALNARLYGGITQKILEYTPITEEQSTQWASGKVIDKSALATLKKQGYLEPEIRRDMAELYRLSGGRFGKCHILPRAKGYSRACAETDAKNIHIGPEFTKRTLWHEMGHLFEGDPKYVAVSNAFLDGRVDKAKGLQRLSSLTGNKNYKRDEVAYTDHLFSPYVGKYYRGVVTEVLSMGVQQFSSPELMAELEKSDPEMFHMVAGLLATPPSDVEREAFGRELQKEKAFADAAKPIDEFYKMLDKKIKKNPTFYEPFAVYDTYKSRRGTTHTIVSKARTDDGYSTFGFQAKSKALVLQLTYLYLALQKYGMDGSTDDFKRWGQYNVQNKDSIPTTVPPSWITDGIPDIKAE